jgi:predicted ArsR family transcriptional regulator
MPENEPTSMGLDRKEIDDKILDNLRGGRNVPSNLAEELGVSRQYVSQRLKLLEAADHVENVGRGVYELQDDPRGEDATPNDRPQVDAEAVRDALDDLETAGERGDRQMARDALKRARDALEADDE